MLQRLAMRIVTLFFSIIICSQIHAQEERDSILNRCPVYITDIVSTNNFFIEAMPAVLKVYRDKGQLTVAVEQGTQLVAFYFHSKKLKTGKYNIIPGSRGNDEVEAIYSFKSGDQVSSIQISKGSISVTYDKETSYWLLKIEGIISNFVNNSLTNYKVVTDLYIK